MSKVAFVTTSYPRTEGDAAGHFVEAEALEWLGRGDFVTVLAPGPKVGFGGPWPPAARFATAPPASGFGGPWPPAARFATAPPAAFGELASLGGIHVEWLPGGDAFGFPGALARLREKPWRAAGAATFVVAARRALAALGPFDHVVAHWLVPSAWPCAMASTGSLEVVLHGSDVRLVERLPARARIQIVEALLRRGATFRFVSEELRQRLARATTPALLAHSRVEASPMNVHGAPNRDEARTRLGISKTTQLAVIVGRLVPSKRPEAALRLAVAHGAKRVVFVGDGPLAAGIRDAHPDVTVTGLVARPIALTWIAAADLLVSASRDEGAPTAIREARALGTRVVAVRSGDVAEWALADAGILLVRDD